MGTINISLIKVTAFSFVSFFITIMYAQGNTDNPDSVHSYKMLGGDAAINEMVSRISGNEDYNYRESLSKARVSNTVYHFDNGNFSEVGILKDFRKAARKSTSPEEFRSYFSERDLPFIEGLDPYMVSSLYVTLRKSTLNGYLELLDTTFTSLYAME